MVGGVISDAYKIELKVLTSTEPTSDAHIKPWLTDSPAAKMEGVALEEKEKVIRLLGSMAEISWLTVPQIIAKKIYCILHRTSPRKQQEVSDKVS